MNIYFTVDKFVMLPFLVFIRRTSSHSPPLMTRTASPHFVPPPFYLSQATCVLFVMFISWLYPINVRSMSSFSSVASTVAFTQYDPNLHFRSSSVGGGQSFINALGLRPNRFFKG